MCPYGFFPVRSTDREVWNNRSLLYDRFTLGILIHRPSQVIN